MGFSIPSAFALSNETTLKWSMYNNASNNSWNLYDHAGSANSITVTTGGNATGLAIDVTIVTVPNERDKPRPRAPRRA